MTEYLCIKDFYIEDTIFAKAGDNVILMPDNYTVVNTNGEQKVTNMDNLINNKEYFVPTFTANICTYKEDKVEHPPHYTWLKDKCGIEVIDITRHMDFCAGNAVKYLLRAGYKSEEGYSDKDKAIEDLKKAIWYINDKINQLNNE